MKEAAGSGVAESAAAVSEAATVAVAMVVATEALTVEAVQGGSQAEAAG